MSSTHPGVYSAPLEHPLDRLLSPFDEFIHRQTSSGLLLMATTILALIVANTGLAQIYTHVLHLPLSLSIGAWTIDMSLHHWINDGLMAFFFFVVGLELKRELIIGELASLRKAALPVIAALMGMITPALIYTFINPAAPFDRGWAIPTATDIAFAVGLLAILANRVPKALITFLVALAIVDDLGAVLVIALFYSATPDPIALASAAALVGMLILLNISGIRKTLPYFLVAVCLWYSLLQAGIHPTLAGVIAAFSVPARPKYDPRYFTQKMKSLLNRFDQSHQADPQITRNEEMRQLVQSMEKSAHHVTAPLQRLEHAWHLPVAYLVIPLFAFCNAGVSLTGEQLGAALGHPVFFGITLGLFAGKFIGISLACWIALKLKIAELPAETSFAQIMGVSMLAGIGFTMSIFISQLAFANDITLQQVAMVGIFAASMLSGLGGFIWLWLLGRKAAT